MEKLASYTPRLANTSGNCERGHASPGLTAGAEARAERAGRKRTPLRVRDAIGAGDNGLLPHHEPEARQRSGFVGFGFTLADDILNTDNRAPPIR